jgi:hypothetical protein
MALGQWRDEDSQCTSQVLNLDQGRVRKVTINANIATAPAIVVGQSSKSEELALTIDYMRPCQFARTIALQSRNGCRKQTEANM